MLTPIQEVILRGIVLTGANHVIGHECAEQNIIPCPGCLAVGDGYYTRKPYAHADTPSQTLENAMWHLVRRTPEFDTSQSSTDPETAGLWLLYDANQKVLLWKQYLTSWECA